MATAGVAALTALVGFLTARGVFSIPGLAPEDNGAWGDVRTPTYALGAAVAALVATGLIHVLIRFAPTPSVFFGWIMALAIVAGVVAPFGSSAASSAEWATAAINLAIGVAIWALVAQVAGSAVRPAPTALPPLGSRPPSGNVA